MDEKKWKFKGDIAKFELTKRIPLEQRMDGNGNFLYSIMERMYVDIVKKEEEVICDRIIKFAEEMGYTRVYLIDRDFIMSAIENEIARRRIGG